MSSADQVRLSIGIQSAWDSRASTMSVLRIIGDDANPAVGQEQQEFEIGGGVTPSVYEVTSLQGRLRTRHFLSLDTLDDVLSSVLFSSALLGAGSMPVVDNVSASSSPDEYTDADTGGFVSPFVAGKWVMPRGFDAANPNNNLPHKITSVPDSSNIRVNGPSLTTEASAASQKVQCGDQISAGTTLRFFTIEKAIQDASGGKKYIIWDNAIPTGFSLRMNGKGAFTVDVTWLANPAVFDSSPVDASPTAATTTNVLTTISNLSVLLEGGGATSYATARDCIKGFSMDLQNGAQLFECNETVLAYGAGIGPIRLSASIELAFPTDTTKVTTMAEMLDKVRSRTASALAWAVRDGDAGLLIEYPNGVPIESSVPTPGPGGEVIARLNIGGKKNASGNAILVNKWDGAAS